MKAFAKVELAAIQIFAQNNGWKRLKSTDPYMVSFEKGERENWNRINVWTSKKNYWYTLGTYVNHPKQGRTQLFRKGLQTKELEQFFKNPRKHTVMGCYVNLPDRRDQGDWLLEHGELIEPHHDTFKTCPDDKLPVVLVFNPQGFVAAGVCFSDSEWKEFSDPGDPRMRKYYLVDKSKLYKVSPLEEYLPKEQYDSIKPELEAL